jgi:toxin ParE1/3/4
VTVNWTDTAIAHLQAIHAHIVLNSPYYAQRTIDRITRRSEQLANLPHTEAIVPEYASEDVREIFEKPYRIIYRILPDRVDVLAVIHGARRLPLSI